MNDLVRRQDAFEELKKEYNRKGAESGWNPGFGLKLAWIEKAINSVPAVQPEVLAHGEGESMSNGIMLMIGDDGIAREYSDEFDVVIHCESEEEREKVIDIINSKQWVPCSERMPEEAYGCLVTIHGDDPFCGEYEKVYYELVGWDGECWNDADGCTIPHEVTAWMMMPEPYKEEDDDSKGTD